LKKELLAAVVATPLVDENMLRFFAAEGSTVWRVGLSIDMVTVWGWLDQNWPTGNNRKLLKLGANSVTKLEI
jgi:hypothetical protein